MTKYEIEIDPHLIPNGMEPFTFRAPKKGELFLSGAVLRVAACDVLSPQLILRRIPLWPKELIGRWVARDRVVRSWDVYPTKPEQHPGFWSSGYGHFSWSRAKVWFGFDAPPPTDSGDWKDSLTFIDDEYSPIGNRPND